ncbi:acyltransferase [Novosphingobium sp. G106]|uniref:acyltransferase n=1 Tax=Novosphingobium sp. G106 TaxID=2849500 RepID=UPI001C2D0AF2|nr:acyltransferase [Novosphingobium sp. G106]MBV1691281.1 acyltransferase [Novosphingobium sp. G106]
MSLTPIDDLAALLKIDRDALERAVPGIERLLSDERLFGLLPLIAASARRESTEVEADLAIREQILRYHATELMTDRERAAFLGLPEGCRIRERAKILAPEKFVCGKNVWIGEGAVLDAQGGLTVGDSTQIGLGVMVWTHTSHLQAIRGETGTSRKGIAYMPTHIGKNCFISGPSVISAGVTIGDGAVISPMTFVDRDVAPREVVSGPLSLKKLERRIDELERRLAESES